MKKIALLLAVIMTISALTFTCSAETLKISPKPDITVKYGSGYTTVTISPASGTTFRYTTDGSKPTKKSAKYKKPLTLKKNTTLQSTLIKKRLQNDRLQVQHQGKHRIEG